MTNVEMFSGMSVELAESSASDELVVRAARVSTVGFDEPVSGTTAGLIKFLMKNRHGTPFEHNSFTFRVHAPIFVMREFQRHRIGWSYNEESGRYRELAPVFYTPAKGRPLVQTGKPGQYTFAAGSQAQEDLVAETLRRNCYDAYRRYESLLIAGVAKEVARMTLPVNTYSSMYATCNARSLMAFLSLRTTDERAAYPSFPQREIEMVATKMEVLFRNAMPQTWNAFTQFGRVSP
jgi:thymidylate synthase (FAD)